MDRQLHRSQENKVFSRYPFILEFLKFAVVGTLGAAVDFSVYALLTRAWHWYYIYATAVSVFLAILNNFLLNKYWTFKKGTTGKTTRESVRFFIVSLINYFLQLGILYSVVEFTSLQKIFGQGEDLAAKVIAIGIVLFSNYFGNKFWTFRD